MLESIVEKTVITLPASIKKVLKTISENKLGIVFAVDDKGCLIGSITDGDIRRAMLQGIKLEKEGITTESIALNRKPFSLPFESDIQEILYYLDQDFQNRTIKCIPLLDTQGRIIDISIRSRIRRFPIYQPEIGIKELSNVVDCVRSGWISSQGSYITRFEKLFSNYLHGGHAVAVSSGTTALQLGMVALGIGPGDEVIVPNFTFAACVNSIIHCGAKPVLVDVDKETWTLDLNKIKKSITPATKAIMPVHIYGKPCRMDELIDIAKKNDLLIVEDCAEAIGAEYKNRLVGLDGNCSCFSFFANKIITTGEGGMVVFKNIEVANKARILRDHGMSKSKSYWHKYAGFNFRMTNMQAAIGVAQIERIEELLKCRQKIFENYNQKFKKIENISLIPINNWSKNSFWFYTIVVNNIGEKKRDKLLSLLKDRGVECRPAFYPLNRMKPYKKFGQGNYEVSEYLGANSISLPSSSVLTKNEQDYIADAFHKELNNLSLNLNKATK